MSDNWEQYFECESATINGKYVEYYCYKDKGVIKLPDNLPMPPTESFDMMFNSCDELKDISALANWDVSNIKDMSDMFRNCKELKDISALSNWNVSNVKNMSYMFVCLQIQDISALANWNTSNVWNMGCMFDRCDELKDISALANWDTSNVEVRGMFSKRYYPNVSDFDSQMKAYLSDLHKCHIINIDLPFDWQNIEIPQWNP